MMRRGLLRRTLLYPRSVWVTVRSQMYNSNRDIEWVLLTVMHPFHVLLSTGLRYAGPAFVFLVIVLISCVVVNWYLFLMPVIVMQHSLPVIIIHWIVSHWLLINISFHYCKAWTTAPGRPTYVQGADKNNLRHDWTWCKKCLQPKPPRTHHCSVCKRCTLKMDHHCPWLNNCVGHFNHRYFWMFCVYMWLGVVYVAITSLPIVLDDHWKNPIEVPPFQVFLPHTLHFGERFSDMYARWQSSCRLFIFFLVCAVMLVLGGLTSWHSWLVALAATSIERHTNAVETKRLARMQMYFKNPYDFGFTMNWKLFLGLVEGRSWRHILLPSSHTPIGDGQHWDYSPYLAGITQPTKAHDV